MPDNKQHSHPRHNSISDHLSNSISDHLPQFCIFSTHENSGTTYEKVNQNFILDFLDIDWDSTFVECGLDPNLCFNIFDFEDKRSSGSSLTHS